MRRHFNCRMLARFSALTLTILVLIAASAKTTASTHADARSDAARIATAPAPQTSQCVATVPKTWGGYRGGSAQSGLAFEDSNGTLRFITNLP
jgi:hypothetical protein